MSVNLSALAGAGQQFFSDNGVILSGGKLYSYAAGTTTPQAAYTSASGSTPHTNPIILNSAGRVATGEIWLTAGENYKFSLFTSTDVLIATWDNITGIASSAATATLTPSGYTTATTVQAGFDDLGSSAGTSKVGFIQAGTGAVSRAAQAKLRESVSVKDFGAVGDGVADDTAAINLAMSAAWSQGVALYFPGGTYITQGGHTLPLNVKATSILGDGPSLSILKCSNATSTVLTVTGMSQFYMFGIGFDKVTRNSLGKGLVINNTAYAEINQVTAYGFENGFYTEDVLTSIFIKPLARFCSIGMFLSFTSISRPNAITILNPSFSLNDRFGLRLNQPGTLNVIGGSIEGNGWNTASFHGGVYISNAGTEGGVGVTFDSVQIEQNEGEADIYIASTLNAGTVYNILNCSIFPVDNTHYTDNRIYFENGVQQNLKLRGNSFKSFGTYTPNAARKNVAALSNALLTVDTGGDYTQFYDAVEKPDLASWGPNTVREAMATARATVQIAGGPTAVLIGAPYNIASVSFSGTGLVSFLFAKLMLTTDYQIFALSDSGSKTLRVSAKNTNGFTLETRDLAGVVQNAGSDVVVFGGL